MRWRVSVALLAALAAGVAYLSTATAAEEIKDIKGCMAFQGKVSGDLPKQVKAKDWEEVKKQTEAWVKVAESLPDRKPPKGDEKSWKDQTEKYLTNVKAVDAAADKKDAEGVNKGLATIKMSCGGCHSKHKPPKN
jgi:cytochrome c556